MPLPRLLTIVLAVSFILGMVIWLIDAILRLYSQVAWTSPFLANIVILLVIAVLALLIATFFYYFNLANQPKDSSGKKRRRIKLPEQKNETAAANLQAVRRQMQQIQDQVAQKALLEKTRLIEAQLKRGNLNLVVFGTGSAGKTSLVNALLGQIQGEVAPTMGTTIAGEKYYLYLDGVSRDLEITDTPGILEAGVRGTERETAARQLATEADLLLFVVDNDLRQSEYEPLQALAKIGKRSLLILNKTDLYPPDEVEVLLQTLRQRVKAFIPPEDVLAIAARPQDVAIQPGLLMRPEPEIEPLVKRLVSVLRSDGDDLMADNILLQSQRLGDEARQIIEQQRQREAMKIIDRYQWIGAGAIAVTPLPVIDLLATTAINAQMVVEIGRVYGCEIDGDRGKELAISLGKTFVGLGIVKGAVELMAQAMQLQLTTYIIGKAIQGITAAYLTRIAGKSFIQYFRQDQDWGDGGVAQVVEQQFQLSRKDEFIQAFVKQAIAKVVEPLEDFWGKESPDTTPEQLEPLPELRDLTPLEEEFIEAILPEPEVYHTRYADWDSPRPQRQDDW
ncbi:slr1462 [Synechocystis sp. PCC 6803]|uniref:Slr1462 protein n=1 Tax=Synechocystis sp. (strain ATCC 27184 / PCC 6803 / Kazusa) TaxID=1111708 RepID=P74555_SYNY3|nr:MULTISPECIES: GTP-binding protein [unclassified Synechocystis]BAM53476.1 hypothetical protein BEST7613_4545 [Synechocystis sp. PCC 6803] [Bacillus subtilis BEST7613]AGF53212.1 hypothetical protein MYO_129870 [Synechocystis sp. PCC 6803]ALJ69086.1 GTP-binding protein [Synechocystis sp. PCC 6803]AVP90952.1 DUF697 domain-containing protein [Synechocystis sp. IPPAS B-1465]MBD2618072.1 DUF697 domain-containing protein [Synechocystis sp. FACHB-898]